MIKFHSTFFIYFHVQNNLLSIILLEKVFNFDFFENEILNKNILFYFSQFFSLLYLNFIYRKIYSKFCFTIYLKIIKIHQDISYFIFLSIFQKSIILHFYILQNSILHFIFLYFKIHFSFYISKINFP